MTDNKMKLAEALLLRSDLQKQLLSLKARLAENSKVQDGDSPSEAPSELIGTANQVISQLYQIIARIHKTNASARLPDGRLLLDVLNERDEYSERHKLLTHTISATKMDLERYSMREIKWQKTIDSKALQASADDIAIKLRHLNAQIQAANWQIDLLDS